MIEFFTLPGRPFQSLGATEEKIYYCSEKLAHITAAYATSQVVVSLQAFYVKSLDIL